MKRSTRTVLVGIGLGTALYYGWRWYAGLRRIRHFHLSTQDLISGESAERLLENCPYRSKLDLVSRMVLSQVEYEAI